MQNQIPKQNLISNKQQMGSHLSIYFSSIQPYLKFLTFIIIHCSRCPLTCMLGFSPSGLCTLYFPSLFRVVFRAVLQPSQANFLIVELESTKKTRTQALNFNFFFLLELNSISQASRSSLSSSLIFNTKMSMSQVG